MTNSAAIIGAGPAGLIAAEILSANGRTVTIYDRMPSIGRKFLMAGRGGLNLTHSEPFDSFVRRYGAAADWARPLLEAYGPEDLIGWAQGLGQETFAGSSGRVFPKAMKASPLLRAWQRRLSDQGVTLRLRHRWQGWDGAGRLAFSGPEGPVLDKADATVLALGGGSWPKLGSDGLWTDILRARGAAVATLMPSNCGVRIVWSETFRTRHAGQPLNNIRVSAGRAAARGEATITQYGLEGGAVYALSGEIRAQLASGETQLSIDLRPDMSLDSLARKLDAPRRGDSASNFLRKRISLAPAGINLMREAGTDLNGDPMRLARAIKNIALTVQGLAGLDRAISSAGGLSRDALDEHLQIRGLDGVYAVGEMIDWDAPTGGYLLQLCFATGVHAARRICNI